MFLQALAASEQQVAEQREALKAKQLEIERLKATIQDQGNFDGGDEADNCGGIPKKKKTTANDDGGLQTEALQAGKAFTICNALWLEPGVMSFLALIKEREEGSEDEEQPDIGEEDMALMEQAQAIYNTLPPSLRPHAAKKWFHERVSRRRAVLLVKH